MKKEILSINNFNMKFSSAINLKDISLLLIEGECTAFLGLAGSGKSQLIEVICGDEWSHKGKITLDGEIIGSAEQIKAKVHKIIDINYAISDWTVAEYIGLVSGNLTPWIFQNSKLTKELAGLFDKLNIQIDVCKKLKDLTEIQKRLVDLVKAYRKQTKILVIEDEFSGFANDEIRLFKNKMDILIKNRMTVVINANSNNVNQILSDNYIILKKGRIVKKCKKDFVKSIKHLEKMLLITSPSLHKTQRKNIKKGKDFESKIVLDIENILVNKSKTISLQFLEGQVTTLLTLNRNDKQRLFDIICGRQIDKNTVIKINRKKVGLKSIADFVKNKIVSIDHLGSWDELLQKMPIGENILMPSLRKISSFKYIANGSQISMMLQEQLLEKNESYNVTLDNKESLDSIFILLERWYVYRPKVLVFLEPFFQCDVYGSSIVKTYIKKFVDIGTAVIIIKSRDTDIKDISNRIITI